MQQPYGPPPGGYPPPGYYGPPGGPPPKRGMGGGTIALIVIACMFGGCVMCGALGAASKKDGEQQATAGGAARAPEKAAPTPTTKPKPEAVAVTASQLFSDYQANEVGADEKYKGRPLRVSGSVTDIKKDFTDSIVVHLRSSNQFMPVDAHVEDSEKGKAAQLAKGENVTVRCEGGGMIIGRPQLTDCTIE
jgi:hypothetical protein